MIINMNKNTPVLYLATFLTFLVLVNKIENFPSWQSIASLAAFIIFLSLAIWGYFFRLKQGSGKDS